jgi:processive 1,2-diacylglycerol beta-glucosyltransferase
MGGKRVLLIYASVGAGHEKACKALEEAFKSIGVDTITEDFISNTPRALHLIIKDTYLQIIKYIPEAYDLAYKFTLHMDIKDAQGLARFISLTGYPFFKSIFERVSPDVVISTHPLTTLGFSMIKGKDAPNLRLINVLTDFHILNLFLAQGVDFHTVPNEHLLENYKNKYRRNVPLILPLGVPVSLNFLKNVDIYEARKLLGFNNDEKVVLVMAGGLGLSGIVEVAETISDVSFREKITIVFLTGKNEKALKELSRIENEKNRANKILYVPWTEDVWLYMKAVNMLISKAGGVTIAEAALCGLPLVIYKPLPGQERINANFLNSHSAAILAKNKEELSEFVNKVLFEGHDKTLRENIVKLAKPNASLDIARKSLE